MTNPMTKAERFDVAVVGAGAAGCVAAARLAEHGPRSVILLEAGPDLRGRMPAQMRNGWEIVRGELDWGYVSQPDEAVGVLPVRRRITTLGRPPATKDGLGMTCFRTSSASSQISISAPILGMAHLDRCRRTATSTCRMPRWSLQRSTRLLLLAFRRSRITTVLVQSASGGCQ